MKKIDLSITSYQTPNHNYSGSIMVSETLEPDDIRHLADYRNLPFVTQEENCVPEISHEESSPSENTKRDFFYCCTFNRGILTGLCISDPQTHCPVNISSEFTETIKSELKKIVKELHESRNKSLGRPKMIWSPDGSKSFPDHEVVNTISTEIKQEDYFKIFNTPCCA